MSCYPSLRFLAATLSLCGCLACNKAEPPRPAGDAASPLAAPVPAVALAPGASAQAEASLADVAEARVAFARRCQICHGPDGRGNGPMAASLRPPPRSFADPAWQQATQDADIAAIILRGGAAVGRSAAMPAAADLERQPGLLAGLVRVVRDFSAPPER